MPEKAAKPAGRTRMGRLSKLFALSWQQRFVLVEALLWLAVTGAAIHTQPFQRLVNLLKLKAGETAAAGCPPVAEPVGWAIRVISLRTPWLSTCLAQAMAGYIMLRRRQIPATVYLGVAMSPTESLQAHAWLRCGEKILTGQAGRGRYKTIACFVAPAKNTPLDN